MNDIAFPSGCRPITEDLGPDELIRRLKTLTNTLQTMGQDPSVYQPYIPLALRLADDYYLMHSSKDVQLLVACCIADMLRVFAPEAPYKDAAQVNAIFAFLIKQLNGLKDPKDPAFKRYFYLLENLSYVKSFNMCFELEDAQDLFCNLFSLIFRIVNDEHSSKVKSFMLDLLTPIIIESDNVSVRLLDIILMHIVEPHKTARKNAYGIAKELIVRTSSTLETYIRQFFNQVIVLDILDKTYPIYGKIYDLIYELNLISPSILTCVLPQLECKLKADHESERLQVVALLARMFSEKDSTLAKQHKSLWESFLERFCDIAVPIRVKCVQSSMHFFLNHVDHRDEIIASLKLRQHDADYIVRYEVVMAIAETAKRDCRFVSESFDLLQCVKERTLDKKFKIRKEAMNGLAFIYKKYLADPNVSEVTKEAIQWIKDKILHGYYMTGIEDRLLVERLLITCLVPYQLPAEERMSTLFELLGTIDDNATKAFIELQKNQLKVRKNVFEWIKLHQNAGKGDLPQKLKLEMNAKCATISRLLTEPVKTQEFLKIFSDNLRKDPSLLKDMETILKRDVSCKECADTMASLLKKLGQPVMTNLYYNTVKMLLERIASVMVDKDAIEVLLKIIEDCMRNQAEKSEQIHIPQNVLGERGFKLISVLAYVFAAHFQRESILRHMISLLSYEEEYVAPNILKAFTYLGRYKAIADSSPDVLAELASVCKEFAMIGTPKQAKHAIRCMFINTQTDILKKEFDIFSDLIESFKITLCPEHENYRTAIVALGHIAYNLPLKYQIQLKNLISSKIVKDLLVKDLLVDVNCTDDKPWCDEEELPEMTRCKIEGFKAMARWLLGLKDDVASAQKTFRLLNAIVKQKGDLLESKKLSGSEMSWLRLSAGKAMLKICEQKGVGDQFTAEQFYNLSQLMVDPEPTVRETFSKKLHKGLNKGIPLKCLPLDFMGYYALGGRETVESLASCLRTYIETDVNRRREYIKTYTSVEKGMGQLPHILPDYMLVFAITVLTHDPHFTTYDSPVELRQIEKCLWMILEPLILNKEFFCFSFYKNLIDRIKNHKDAFNSNDDEINKKMWAICDVAMYLLYTKSSTYDTRDFPLEARIPSMYFQSQPDDFNNTKLYVPDGVYTATYKSRQMGIIMPVKKSNVRSESSSVNHIDPKATNSKMNMKNKDNDTANNNDDENDSPTQPPRTKKLRSAD